MIAYKYYQTVRKPVYQSTNRGMPLSLKPSKRKTETILWNAWSFNRAFAVKTLSCHGKTCKIYSNVDVGIFHYLL